MTKPTRCATTGERCLRYGASASYRFDAVLTVLVIVFFLVIGAGTDFVVMSIILAAVLTVAYLISFAGNLWAGHRGQCLALRTFAGPIEIFKGLV